MQAAAAAADVSQGHDPADDRRDAGEDETYEGSDAENQTGQRLAAAPAATLNRRLTVPIPFLFCIGVARRLAAGTRACRLNRFAGLQNLHLTPAIGTARESPR